MNTVAIRGATSVDENNEYHILQSTKELIEEIEIINKIDRSQVISILFSVTEDLTKVAPARAARDLGYTNSALMCFEEMKVDNSLKKCIRLTLETEDHLLKCGYYDAL